MSIERLLLYSVLMFGVAMAAGVGPILFKKPSEKLLKLFVSLGAGLLIGMAFLHMLPEAAELVPHAFGLWFLIGFLLLLILERFVMVHACDEGDCHYHTVGITAFAGLTVHGVLEGFALASSEFATGLGPIILFAILFHKAPAATALSSMLSLADMSRRQIILFVTGIALATPIGLCTAYFALTNTKFVEPAGVLLAVSAGTFLYIAACDLLPELHKTTEEKGKRLAAFMFGIAISLLTEVAHTHPH